MPLYEYTCEAGHVSADFRPVDRRREAATCDECGKPASLTPSSFVGQVVGGTPVHYPNL